MKPHRGTLILVLGILSLLLCQLLGIAPLIMGNADLKEMDAGSMDPEGRQLTQVGRILGIVALVLMGVGLIIGILMLVLGGAGAALSA